MNINTRTTKMTRTVNKRRQMSERLKNKNFYKWNMSKFSSGIYFDLVFTPDSTLYFEDEQRSVDGWNKFKNFMNEGKAYLKENASESGSSLFWVDGYQNNNGEERSLPLIYNCLNIHDDRISVRICPYDSYFVDWAIPELLERAGVSTRVYVNGKLYKRVFF